MSRDAESPRHSSEAPKIYNRILARAERALGDIEHKTWETVRQEIDKAAEFEADVADLTREELDLLRAYVQRDMRELKGYMQETGDGVADWLRLDLALVEGKIRDLLLSIADKTLVEHVELDQRLQHDPGTYLAGEVACAGMLQCLNCDHMLCLVETTHIEPCHVCGNQYFRRITSRWPREPELAETEA